MNVPDWALTLVSGLFCGSLGTSWALFRTGWITEFISRTFDAKVAALMGEFEENPQMLAKVFRPAVGLFMKEIGASMGDGSGGRPPKLTGNKMADSLIMTFAQQFMGKMVPQAAAEAVPGLIKVG